MNTTVLHAARRTQSLARTVLGIFKLRIGVLIMISALAGLAITPGPAIGAVQGLVLALSVLVASAAAGAFNQFYEAQADRLMARTRGRAFASGALSASPLWLALIAALLTIAVGATWLVVNPAAALFIFLGAFFYGVVYTVWLKRRTWANIVVGGLSGSFAVLAGAAAVDPTLGALPLLLALVLFLWTPPHFWSLAIACRDDYAAAGVPMLPVVAGNVTVGRQIVAYSWVMVATSLVLWPVAGTTPFYGVAAVVLGAAFLVEAHRLLRRAVLEADAAAAGHEVAGQSVEAGAMRLFHGSITYLTLLFLVIAIDPLLPF
jgi:protoheme IX farnesyltransferase